MRYQKVINFDSILSYIHHCLDTASIHKPRRDYHADALAEFDENNTKDTVASKLDMFDSYSLYCNQAAMKFKNARGTVEFYKKLRQVIPSTEFSRPQGTRSVVLPPLATCRKAFSQFVKDPTWAWAVDDAISPFDRQATSMSTIDRDAHKEGIATTFTGGARIRAMMKTI